MSRGGSGDAARVQMRMKCESVDHGVDGVVLVMVSWGRCLSAGRDGGGDQ